VPKLRNTAFTVSAEIDEVIFQNAIWGRSAQLPTTPFMANGRNRSKDRDR
jgi:hypothetical protein